MAADDLHHVGDSCRGGHFDDPFEASRLNDQLLDQEEPTGHGMPALTDRQAAMFAATHLVTGRNSMEEKSAERVTRAADVLHTWLTSDHEATDD